MSVGSDASTISLSEIQDFIAKNPNQERVLSMILNRKSIPNKEEYFDSNNSSDSEIIPDSQDHRSIIPDSDEYNADSDINLDNWSENSDDDDDDDDDDNDDSRNIREYNIFYLF